MRDITGALDGVRLFGTIIVAVWFVAFPIPVGGPSFSAYFAERVGARFPI
jgi:hypothetical protein